MANKELGKSGVKGQGLFPYTPSSRRRVSEAGNSVMVIDLELEEAESPQWVVLN